MARDWKKKTSRFLSLVLRHKPEAINISLDQEGWTDVDKLLKNMRNLSRQQLELLVSDNDKQRFEFSEDGKRIRASQGHSLKVDLQLVSKKPPDRLYHGTFPKAMEYITSDGLKPMSRHHVHMAADTSTAVTVGSRRGAPILLEISAGKMFDIGYEFYCSNNGVWLTDKVPPIFLKEVKGSKV
jgi:putative RNA 2'-phosphotransferase